MPVFQASIRDDFPDYSEFFDLFYLARQKEQVIAHIGAKRIVRMQVLTTKQVKKVEMAIGGTLHDKVRSFTATPQKATLVCISPTTTVPKQRYFDYLASICEAARAACAIEGGLHFARASVVDSDGLITSLQRFRPVGIDEAEIEHENAKLALQALLCGKVAKEILDGNDHPSKILGDFAVLSLARCLATHDELVQEFLDQQTKAVFDWLKDNSVWEGVRRLSEALLVKKKLSSHEARHIYYADLIGTT